MYCQFLNRKRLLFLNILYGKSKIRREEKSGKQPTDSFDDVSVQLPHGASTPLLGHATALEQNSGSES
jgi:hypothetical protein